PRRAGLRHAPRARRPTVYDWALELIPARPGDLMSSIRYEKGADGVVTLLLDAPDQPVNTMNAGFQADLRESVARLEAERHQIRGVIVTSAKRTFFAGGDLRALIA